MVGEVAVQLEDVKYTYPDGCRALKGVSLKIYKGERVAVLGPNGAGKSTLLMHINGLLTPSEGRVKLLDMPVEGSNLREVRRRVGFVFQDPNDQLFCPTIWEDVTFGPLNMGLPKGEVVRVAEDALKAVSLEGYRERAPHHLSLGEKKRAAIATVLAMNPEILVLDEPTANLDPKSRRELVTLLNSLYTNRGVTLITATHDVNLIPSVADRLYIMSEGLIVAEGPLREVLSSSKLMREARLELPPIIQLFNLLYDGEDAEGGTPRPPLPLTVEEALHEVQRLLGKKLDTDKASVN